MSEPPDPRPDWLPPPISYQGRVRITYSSLISRSVTELLLVQDGYTPLGIDSNALPRRLQDCGPVALIDFHIAWVPEYSLRGQVLDHLTF